MSDLKEGSPAWRDAQDKELETLVSNPDKWEFKPTEQHKAVVISAYEAVASEISTGFPDTNQVRLMVAQVLPSKMDLIRFWMEFCSDMPDAMKRQMWTMESAWSEFKIQHILTSLKKAFIEWDSQEVTCIYKSPESLRETAERLELNEGEGYGLYDVQVDEVRGTVKYQFRKANLVKVKEDVAT